MLLYSDLLLFYLKHNICKLFTHIYLCPRRKMRMLTARCEQKKIGVGKSCNELVQTFTISIFSSNFLWSLLDYNAANTNTTISKKLYTRDLSTRQSITCASKANKEKLIMRTKRRIFHAHLLANLWKTDLIFWARSSFLCGAKQLFLRVFV